MWLATQLWLGSGPLVNGTRRDDIRAILLYLGVGLRVQV